MGAVSATGASAPDWECYQGRYLWYADATIACGDQGRAEALRELRDRLNTALGEVEAELAKGEDR